MLTRSMLDRLADYTVDDLPTLYGVPPAGVEAPVSSNQEPVNAPVVTEVDSIIESCLSTEIFPIKTHTENERSLQTTTAAQKGGLSVPLEETAKYSTSRALPEDIARLQSIHREMEASLRGLARDCEKRQAGLAAAINDASAALQTVQRRMVGELKDEAEMIVKDLLSRSTEQVQEQADAVVAALGEKLSASSQGFIDETEKHLSSVAETSLGCLTTAATEQTRKQLNQMLEEFLAKGTSLSQDCEKQQAELAAAINDASAALQTVQRRMVGELKDEAEMIVKDLLSRSTEQVQEQADAVVAALGEKLSASSQGFIDETEKHLSSVAETSLGCLTTAATEQTRKQLNQMLEEFLAKGTSLSQDCEKQQAELAAAINDASAALQTVQRRMVGELKDEAEMIVKDLLSRSTEQVQEQADAVVAALGEKLSASSQGFIDETEKHLSSVAETSLGCLTTAANEQTRKQLNQMLEEFLAKGTSLSQDCEKRQAELAAAINDASAALQTVQRRMVSELKEEAEIAVKDLVNRSTKQVQEQADAVVAASGEKLSASSKGFIDETEKHLSCVASGPDMSMSAKNRD